MEREEMTKRLEKLDDERRKDKIVIATLDKRLLDQEAVISDLLKQNKEISSEVTRLTALISRIDKFDSTLSDIRIEIGRSIEKLEKQRSDHDRRVEDIRREDLDSINKIIAELRNEMQVVNELRDWKQARIEEETRVGRKIDEFERKLEDNLQTDDEYRRAQRLLDEGRRQDTKRLTDLQGEVSALRKRTNEHRGKLDVAISDVRRLDLRLNEIHAADSERRETQATFIEMLMERERIWKDWESRFGQISKQATDLDDQMKALDVTHLAVKRSHESFEESKQRFDRRINEITEMQRLAEKRFSQEWVNFKADDQKRWNNYSLIQEERSRENGRQFEENDDRLIKLEDLTQEIRDILLQNAEATQKGLQAFLAQLHQWMEEYNRNTMRLG